MIIYKMYFDSNNSMIYSSEKTLILYAFYDIILSNGGVI